MIMTAKNKKHKEKKWMPADVKRRILELCDELDKLEAPTKHLRNWVKEYIPVDNLEDINPDKTVDERNGDIT